MSGGWVWASYGHVWVRRGVWPREGLPGLVPRQATFAPERPTRVSGGPAEGPPSAEVAEGTFVSSPEGAS